MSGVTSTKPYLMRAIYDWALDNGLTPQILVNAVHESVVVPREHVKDGQIVLNIHPQSVRNISLGNDYVMCSARFSGRAFELTVPPATGSADGGDGPDQGGGGHLKLVK